MTAAKPKSKKAVKRGTTGSGKGGGKRTSLHSTKKKTHPKPGCCPAPAGDPPAPTDDCMPVCQTGVCCLFFRDAAGELDCLPLPAAGDKYLRATPNGLYWSNI